MQNEERWFRCGRLLLVVVAALVVALGVAACGGGGSSSSSSPAETTESEPAETETTSEEAEAPAAEGGKLVAESVPGGFPVSEGGEADPALVKSALTEEVPKATMEEAYEAAFGAKFDVEKGLAPWAKSAYEIALQKLTPEEEKFVMECIENTSCSRNEGELTIAFIDGFGGNAWRRQNRVGTVYALSRYPQVKEFVYSEAGGDLQTLQSNIRAAISQGVDAIIGDFDLGDAVMPQVREARAAGIPVIALSQGLPSAKYDGTDLNWLLNQNLCQLGYNLGESGAESAPNAEVAMYTGIPGNPFAAGWQPCAEEAVEKGGGTITTKGTTEWSQQGNAQAASALLAEGIPNAVIYDEDLQDFMTKFVAAGAKPMPTFTGFLNQGAYEIWKEQQAKGNKFTIYSTGTQNSYGFLAAFLAVGAVEEMLPPELKEGQIETPATLLDGEELGNQYVKGAGATAAFGSLLPENLLIAAQKAK